MMKLTQLFIVSLVVWSSIQISPAYSSLLSPESLSLKVYSISLSKNKNCSDPVELFSNDDPEYIDFLGENSLGEGNIQLGEYQCVMIEMSDHVKYSPEKTISKCVKGEEYTLDVFNIGNHDEFGGYSNINTYDEEALADFNANTFLNPDFNDHIVSPYEGLLAYKIGEQKVWIYLSTASQKVESVAWTMPPQEEVDTKRGFKLHNSLKIDKDLVARFVVNGKDRVYSDYDDTCYLAPPLWSFKHIKN